MDLLGENSGTGVRPEWRAAPAGGDLVTIDGSSFGGDNLVSIDNLRFNGQTGLGNFAINVKSTADFGTLSVNQSDFTGFDFNAIIVSGNENTNVSSLVDNVNISNSTFSNNGVAGGGGAGDIQLFVYNGNASLTNLTLVGTSVGTSGACSGIQFRGVGTQAGVGIVPSGTISLNNIDISGTYVTQMIGIQRYSDVSGFSFNNVRLGGGSSDITGTFARSCGSMPSATLLPRELPARRRSISVIRTFAGLQVPR